MSSWTKGKWTSNGDTLFFQMIPVYDTLNISNAGDQKSDSLVLSSDETASYITHEQFAIESTYSGGQNRRPHPEKLFLKKERLYEIHNGKILTKKIRGVESRKKVDPYYTIEERVILKWEPYLANDTLEKCKAYDLTLPEVNFTDSFYYAVVDLFNNLNDSNLDPKKYKRQYFAFINGEGNKEVYINCFCNCFCRDEDEWKKKHILVFGGGACFFQLQVNLDKASLVYFTINEMY
jgi:hypothetical protein